MSYCSIYLAVFNESDRFGLNQRYLPYIGFNSKPVIIREFVKLDVINVRLISLLPLGLLDV